MMNIVITGLFTASFIFAAVTGHMTDISSACVTSAGTAVTLIITLAGIICLWSGLMRVCTAAGVTKKISALLKPLLTRLFSGIDPQGEALGFISLNLTANMLGLGNASTPLGIKAMQALEKEEGIYQGGHGWSPSQPSPNMLLLTVLNTASLQILPTTVAALRLKHGSAAPMEILPCVWAVSAVSVTLTVIFTKAWCKK